MALVSFFDSPAHIRVALVPTLVDNYVWILHNGTHALVVDPGDLAPVRDYLRAQNLELNVILITHHHNDHINAVPALIKQFPNVSVYGPDHPALSFVTHRLCGGDNVSLEYWGLRCQVMAVSGHTLSHVAYFVFFDAKIIKYAWLFCGDTLFATGCGRLFEGTPEQMLASLHALAELPPTTLICCAHEYTLANIKFALAVDKENQDLHNWQEQALSLRALGQATVPTTLAHELRTNPFLRCRDPNVIAAAQCHAKKTLLHEVDVFAVLRQWKNNF